MPRGVSMKLKIHNKEQKRLKRLFRSAQNFTTSQRVERERTDMSEKASRDTMADAAVNDDPEATVEVPLVEPGAHTLASDGSLESTEPESAGLLTEEVMTSPNETEDENENVLLSKNYEVKSELNAEFVPSSTAQVPVIAGRTREKRNKKRMSIDELPRVRSSTYMIGILGEEMSPTSVRRQLKGRETQPILKNGTPQCPSESESGPKDDE